MKINSRRIIGIVGLVFVALWLCNGALAEQVVSSLRSQEELYKIWQACEFDDECALAEVYCGSLAPANRKYAHEMTQESLTHSWRRCVPYRSIPNVACKQNRCVRTEGEGSPDLIASRIKTKKTKGGVRLR